MNSISQKISDISSDDIVEVLLTGEVSEDSDIETDSYQSVFATNYYLIRIKDKTEAKINYDKYENDVSLKGEFIRLVKEQNDLTDEEKAKVIITGIKALAGRLN